MSQLSSTSTFAEIEASYMDNASYEEDADAGKAKAFVTACRLLIQKTNSQLTSDGQTSAYDVKLLQAELRDAQMWLTANGGSSSFGNSGGIAFDMRGFRP